MCCWHDILWLIFNIEGNWDLNTCIFLQHMTCSFDNDYEPDIWNKKHPCILWKNISLMLRLESSPIPLLWLKEHYVHKMQVHTTYNNTSDIIHHIYIYIYLIYIVVHNLYALLISLTNYNTSMHYHVMDVAGFQPSATATWLPSFSSAKQWWFLVKKLHQD